MLKICKQLKLLWYVGKEKKMLAEKKKTFYSRIARDLYCKRYTYHVSRSPNLLIF